MADMWRTTDGKKLLARNSADELLFISGGTARKYPQPATQALYTGAARRMPRQYPLWGPTAIGSEQFFYPLSEHLAVVRHPLRNEARPDR